MTSLETRLRSLRQAGGAAPSPAELRRWSAARSRRRLFTAAAVAVPFIAVALAVFVAAEKPADQLVAEPSSTTGTGNGGPNRTLGDVTGVRVDVSPRTDLHDGDLVEVRIDGLEEIPDAQILLCAGDVQEADAAAACAYDSVEQPVTDQIGPVTATDEQVVSVPRIIRITRGSSDPNTSRRYDCATEDAGCVLAVGPYAAPARAVLVPLTFIDEPALVPEASITPSAELTDLQQVTLVARGLQPNGAFVVRLCAVAPSDQCDEIEWPSVRSDEAGSLTATVTVRTSIYGYQGPIDCVASSCAVVVSDGDARVAEVPFRFAPGVKATVAELRLDPPGPHTDGQMVTVHGTGFPPGFDLGGHLGQCPADKDTAVEERCGYAVITPIIVDPDGTFTVTLPLSDSLIFTGSCMTGPGCVLAWVLNHGPIAASVPLGFSP
jgi:hypothetical protein